MTGFNSKRDAAADKLQEPERETLELALEALENVKSSIYITSEQEAVALEKVNQTIPAIKSALAQPVQDVDYWIREATAARQAEMAMRRELEAQPAQEPVAGLHAVYFRNNWDGEGDLEYVLAYLSEKGKWTLHENGAPLIEFEGDEIIKTWPITFEGASPPLPAQPAQEPVAWAVVGDGKFGKYEIGRETLTDIDSANYWISRGYKLVSIYTTPPQRPWVGLTKEEVRQCGFAVPFAVSQDWALRFYKAIEAALKDKNNGT
jgi:hypothetical protein